MDLRDRPALAIEAPDPSAARRIRWTTENPRLRIATQSSAGGVVAVRAAVAPGSLLMVKPGEEGACHDDRRRPGAHLLRRLRPRRHRGGRRPLGYRRRLGGAR